MVMAAAQSKILPLAQERRKHQRVKVNLLGRYMLVDRREYPCQVLNMSPGGILIMAPVAGELGDRVIAYVDHLGRLEGKIARTVPNGFAMTIAATSRKRDKLAAQLTWLANRHILNLPEDRRHGRFAPRNPLARLIMPNGHNVSCRVIDLSQSARRLRCLPISAPRSDLWLPSGKRRAGSSATSRTALRSSSSDCSIRTSSKITSPASKRRATADPFRLSSPLSFCTAVAHRRDKRTLNFRVLLQADKNLKF